MNNRKEIDKLWSREKYKVMFYSQKHYNEIRSVLKSGVDVERVKTLIDEAFTLRPSIGSVLNAYQHMWGYFKKYASAQERQTYVLKANAFSTGEVEARELLMLIRELALKYEVDYLLQSTILQLNETENGPLP
ncbi:YbgA family protein [Sporosarcina saromensis]|uniref:YbgA family protein n=1 Tax=Sporosarcina saromensis TaxID=359365 RepID=A0ABU4GEY4_9BACL|nr:YbgA family protein [Sporosarcina saromensis]MDW0114880.1 YbgA family protein [Sporosarcina saromensis]